MKFNQLLWVSNSS